MQTKITCQRGTTRGSALLVMLVTVTLIGITLASYLELVRSQNLSTMRSQQWNSAIPILEAGNRRSFDSPLLQCDKSFGERLGPD